MQLPCIFPDSSLNVRLEHWQPQFTKEEAALVRRLVLLLPGLVGEVVVVFFSSTGAKLIPTTAENRKEILIKAKRLIIVGGILTPV